MFLFVCVAVLWRSQPIRVMATRLPNHTFPWSKRLIIICAHSFARNWQLPYLNLRKGENNRNISWSIYTKRMLPDPAGFEPATSWSPVERAFDWATEAGSYGFGYYAHLGHLCSTYTHTRTHKNCTMVKVRLNVDAYILLFMGTGFLMHTHLKSPEESDQNLSPKKGHFNSFFGTLQMNIFT